MRNLQKLMAVTIGATFFAVTAVQAQPGGTQGTAKSMPLTALDYLEIQQLVFRYAKALDSCSNNGYDYADLYTADGWFAASRDGQVLTKFQGRERLAEAAGGGVAKCTKLNRQGGLWIHVMANPVITPTPEGAAGHVDLVYPLERGTGFDIDHMGHVGHYEDVFVKTPQGWRFKSVIHVMSQARGRGNNPQGAQPAQPGTSR